MPVLYTATDENGTDTTKSLIPAPFVSISKSYNKTGDGKKVGATYSITLEGTIVSDKGSPQSDGSWHTVAGTYPSDESVPADEIQYSLFKKTSAIRKLFATEGKELYIYTWKQKPEAERTGSKSADFGNMGIMCYPRITSVDIGDNRYIGPIPYTITLECEEIFHTIPTPSASPSPNMIDDSSLGEEDFKTAGVNIIHERGQPFQYRFTDYNKDINWSAADAVPKNGFADGWLIGANNSASKKIYLSDISEEWSVEMQDQKKSNQSIVLKPSEATTDNQRPTFSVTHTLSATGKRAYGPDPDGSITGTAGRACLLREPWENGKIWVDERLTPLPNQDRSTLVPPYDHTYVSEMDPDGDSRNNIDPFSSQTPWLFQDDIHGFSWDKVIFPSLPPSEPCEGEGEGESPAPDPSWVAYNYKRSSSISKVNGTYSITETFLLVPFFDDTCDNNVIEDQTYEVSYDLSSNIYSVTVNGSILGLESRKPLKRGSGGMHGGKITFDITESSFDAATARFDIIRPGTGVISDIYDGAESLVPTNGPNGETVDTLREAPLTETISRNISAGTINYSYNFNTRSNNLGTTEWPPLSETISIVDNHPAEKFAEHGIPGRAAGPILECLGTQSAATRSVTAEVKMPGGTPMAVMVNIATTVTSTVNQWAPVAATSFKTSDSENLSIIERSYSRNVTWTFNESC